MFTRRFFSALALAVIGVLAMAACSHSSSSGQAAAAASSAMANPTVSADIALGEKNLTANMDKDFTAAHPVSSMEQALRATFPQGDLSNITTYAVHQLSPADYRKGPARTAWVQSVVLYALNSGATPGTSVSPSPGSANIPGTSQSAVGTS